MSRLLHIEWTATATFPFPRSIDQRLEPEFHSFLAAKAHVSITWKKDRGVIIETISGDKQGVEYALTMIQNLLKEENPHNGVEACVKVPSTEIPHVLGRRKRNMMSLKMKTGATVKYTGSDGRFQINGCTTDVLNAHAEINKIVLHHHDQANDQLYCPLEIKTQQSDVNTLRMQQENLEEQCQAYVGDAYGTKRQQHSWICQPTSFGQGQSQTVATPQLNGSSLAPVGAERNRPSQNVLPTIATPQMHGSSLAPVGAERNRPSQNVLPTIATPQMPGSSLAPIGAERNRPSQNVLPTIATPQMPGSSLAPIGAERNRPSQNVLPTIATPQMHGSSLAPVGAERNRPIQNVLPTIATPQMPGSSLAPIGAERNRPSQNVLPTIATPQMNGSSLAPIGAEQSRPSQNVLPTIAAPQLNGSSLVPIEPERKPGP